MTEKCVQYWHSLSAFYSALAKPCIRFLHNISTCMFRQYDFLKLSQEKNSLAHVKTSVIGILHHPSTKMLC